MVSKLYSFLTFKRNFEQANNIGGSPTRLDGDDNMIIHWCQIKKKIEKEKKAKKKKKALTWCSGVQDGECVDPNRGGIEQRQSSQPIRDAVILCRKHTDCCYSF